MSAYRMCACGSMQKSKYKIINSWLLHPQFMKDRDKRSQAKTHSVKKYEKNKYTFCYGFVCSAVDHKLSLCIYSAGKEIHTDKKEEKNYDTTIITTKKSISTKKGDDNSNNERKFSFFDFDCVCRLIIQSIEIE